ncbi:MAG: TetR/AcrR family transcriptional regulator [Hyphomonadaceae bacterium]|jgi:AcrR family transcriptional regulator|nr:TetR/AcrR family transcriptional regulator [Hyphomonadaceae bacterium]
MSAAETRARIVTAARQLFNEEGYSGLSAVDVANSIGISPGHLYYHFKGKAEIAASLADDHVAELAMIADGARTALAGDGASLQTVWTHTHILMEELADCRFLWRESGLIGGRDDDLSHALKRACRVLDGFAETAVQALVQSGVVRAGGEGTDGVIDQFAMALAFQLNWLELSGLKTETPRALIERAAGLAMLSLTALMED